jgi:hypothetical protein
MDLQSIICELKAEIQNDKSTIYRELSCWLVDVLITNKRFNVEVCDVGYDRSTRAVASPAGFNLQDYSTVASLLETEFTGCTVPTFCSGAGLAAQTLDEAARELLFDLVFEWQKERLPELFEDENNFQAQYGFDLDALSDCVCEELIEAQFYETFCQKTLLAVWNEFLPVTLLQRAEAQAQQKREAEERARIAEKWEACGRPALSSLNRLTMGRRYEQSNASEFWAILEALETNHEFSRLEIAAALRLTPRTFSLSNTLTGQVLLRYPFSA